QELDEKMAQFRNRPLDGEYPYVWLDAKAVKTRENDRVVNMAAVVAVGVRTTGDREVLGFDLGPAETYEFWVTFLRSLVRRGLRGVRLVISDAHEGLRQAIAEVLQGAAWQRWVVSRQVCKRRFPSRTGSFASSGVENQGCLSLRPRHGQLGHRLHAQIPPLHPPLVLLLLQDGADQP